MKTYRLCTKLASLLKPVLPAITAVAVLSMGPGRAQAQDYADWEYEFAYTLGVQAYIFGFPWVNMTQYRWEWVTQPPTTNNDHAYAPLNQFYHATTLKDATYHGGGSPNTDTLYSTAWLDLTNDPVILSVPAIDRYYTFEIVSYDSDNFAYVGTRATWTNAGNYLIAGPNWTGTCPASVTQLIPSSPTPSVLILGRTLVYGQDDLTNVYAIQAQYRLTPLSYWGTTNLPPDNRNVWEPYPTNVDLAVWKTMNRAMTENPPNNPSQAGLVDYFSEIGIGPKQNVDLMDEPTKAGLRDAALEGWILLNQYPTNPPPSYFTTNGWVYPPKDNGRAGENNDFMLRASGQSLLAIANNDGVEAVYLASAGRDASGQTLSGAYNYTMTFPSNGLPDVHAFWSITMYGSDDNLVSNSISRYKVGTYPTNQLVFNPDGTMTIYIQNAAPSADKLSNWLPAPPGAFHVDMRCYLPGSNIINQTWGPPGVLRAGPTLQLEALTGKARVSWNDPAGLRFNLQFTTNLPSRDVVHWSTVPEAVTSTNTHYSWTDDATAPLRYYRVKRLP